MTLGAIIWGLTAELAGTRLTLLTAAFLFLVAVLGSVLLSRIFRNSDIIEDKAPSLSGVDRYTVTRETTASQLRQTIPTQRRIS